MNRWQCRRFAAALVDLAEGELDDARRAALERHLAACPECAADLAALQEVRTALRDLPEPAFDADELAQQRASIRAALDTAPAPHPGWLRPWFDFEWNWPAWRLPATAFASGLLSLLLLFNFNGSHEILPTGVGSLDDAVLFEVHDMTNTLLPHDDLVPALLHETTMLMQIGSDNATSEGMHDNVDRLADDDLEDVNALLDEVS